MIEDTLAPEKLPLDPNNFRFHDLDSFLLKNETHFHESTVQQAAYDRVREDETLLQLKNSIIRNTYIPIERTVESVFDKIERLYSLFFRDTTLGRARESQKVTAKCIQCSVLCPQNPALVWHDPQ